MTNNKWKNDVIFKEICVYALIQACIFWYKYSHAIKKHSWKWKDHVKYWRVENKLEKKFWWTTGL